jgi:hypothetical protein
VEAVGSLATVSEKYFLHLLGISSETLVPTYQTTRSHNPGDHNMNLHRRENPKSTKCSAAEYYLMPGQVTSRTV